LPLNYIIQHSFQKNIPEFDLSTPKCYGFDQILQWIKGGKKVKFKKFIDFCFSSLLILAFVALATWIIWLPIFTNVETIANFFKKFSDDLIGRSAITVMSIIMSVIVGYWGAKAVINNYPLLTRKVGKGDFWVEIKNGKKKISREFSWNGEIYWKWQLSKNEVFTPKESWLKIKIEFLDGKIIKKINYDFFVVPSSLVTIQQYQNNYDLVHSRGHDNQTRKIKKLLFELQKNKPEIFTSFYNPYNRYQEEDFLKAIKLNLDPDLDEFGLKVHYPYFHPTEI